MSISIELYITLLTCSFLGGLLSIGAVILSCVSYINVIGLKNSTHSVQYMPINPEIDQENEAFLKKENWATSQEAIIKEESLYKEELAANMPQFSIDEEDREILSF